MVLVVAVGFAALRSASPLWESILFTASLLAVGVATLGAFLFRGKTRASWGGFAGFGIAYLMLTGSPWSDSIRPRLITDYLLSVIVNQVKRPNPNTSFTYVVTGESSSNSIPKSFLATSSKGVLNFTSPALVPTFRAYDPLEWTFFQIGHSLWTFLVAMCGGMAGPILHEMARRREEDEARISDHRQIGAPDLSVSSIIAKSVEEGTGSVLSG